jgi:hypothetical protein
MSKVIHMVAAYTVRPVRTYHPLFGWLGFYVDKWQVRFDDELTLIAEFLDEDSARTLCAMLNGAFNLGRSMEMAANPL